MKGADVSRAGLFRRFLRESLRPYVPLQIEIFACLAIGVALELADPLLLDEMLRHTGGVRRIPVIVRAGAVEIGFQRGA